MSHWYCQLWLSQKPCIKFAEIKSKQSYNNVCSLHRSLCRTLQETRAIVSFASFSNVFKHILNVWGSSRLWMFSFLHLNISKSTLYLLNCIDSKLSLILRFYILRNTRWTLLNVFCMKWTFIRSQNLNHVVSGRVNHRIEAYITIDFLSVSVQDIILA